MRTLATGGLDSRLWMALALLVGGLLAQGIAAAAADDAPVTRVSESRYYALDGRRQQNPDRVSTDEYPAIAAADGAQKAGRDGSQLRSAGSAGKLANTDFWFYTADVQLFGDEDNDGHYYGVDLLFDVDTVYSHAEIYAVMYLSLDGGPWLEYAETDIFDIYGASSDDEFVVVSELLSGYPAGSYDILIEVFDVFDNAFVADFGPEDSSELSYLALEDAERDTPYGGGDSTIIVNQDNGGGALDARTLFAFGLLTAGLVVLRRRRQRAV